MRPTTTRVLLASSLLAVGSLAGCGSGFSSGSADGGSAGSGGSGGTATGTGGSAGSSAGGSGGSVGCTALNFGPTTTYVDVAHHDEFDGLGALTIEGWIFPTQADASHPIVSHHNMGASEGYALILHQGAVFFWVFVDRTPIVAGGSPATDVSLNAWSHVAGVFDGAEVRVYINGGQRAGTTVSVTTQQTTPMMGPLRIGCAALSANWFIGTIDEVRLSRVARYREDFAVPSSDYSPDADTMALWHFDENGGQFTADAANGHDGILGPTDGDEPGDPEWVEVTCVADRR